MSVIKSEVRPGAYYDSVVLMQLQRALADLPEVIDAGVVMATPANKELLEASGLGVETTAGSDDLLIVIQAEKDEDACHALGQVDELLATRRSSIAQEFRPRSLRAAVKQLPDAAWVLVSVPGRYAAGVAQEALDLNKNVFIFSDNVPLDDEIKLKRKARETGLLVMGPDCGTAIIGGVGLGFANRVRAGRIGVVGASGTGLQAITSQIHNLGGGISQAIGTGGRDLNAKVGAITATQGLELLTKDDNTEVIVVVSKPPEPEVAIRLMATARLSGKPAVIHFIGYPAPARQVGNLRFASNLTDAAQLAVELVNGELAETLPYGEESGESGVASGYLRGLFSGGTLAYEAMTVIQTYLDPIYSNVPLNPKQQLKDVFASQGHTILDLGEDEFTQGRLHPMMDNDLRLRRMRSEAADPEVSIIVLDIVLGEGSHPNPAEEIAPVIAEVLGQAQEARRQLEIVVIIVGTDEDPQHMSDQIATLEEAGAIVFDDTIKAIEYAGRKLSSSDEMSGNVSLASLTNAFSGINVGLEIFFESLRQQGAQAVQVDWRPPAGGNENLMALLAKMK